MPNSSAQTLTLHIKQLLVELQIMNVYIAASEQGKALDMWEDIRNTFFEITEEVDVFRDSFFKG